jgi:hypothetical protein
MKPIQTKDDCSIIILSFFNISIYTIYTLKPLVRAFLLFLSAVVVLLQVSPVLLA